jgi:hypothetical protein
MLANLRSLYRQLPRDQVIFLGGYCTSIRCLPRTAHGCAPDMLIRTNCNSLIQQHGMFSCWLASVARLQLADVRARQTGPTKREASMYAPTGNLASSSQTSLLNTVYAVCAMTKSVCIPTWQETGEAAKQQLRAGSVRQSRWQQRICGSCAWGRWTQHQRVELLQPVWQVSAAVCSPCAVSRGSCFQALGLPHTRAVFHRPQHR